MGNSLRITSDKLELLVRADNASGKNGTQMLLGPHTDDAKHGLIAFTIDQNIAVTGIKLDQTSTKLAVGNTLQLTGTITPANATNQTVLWTSSASTVAQVNSNGLVTGMKAGTTTITAKTIDGNKPATCKVTASVCDLTLSTTEVKLVRSGVILAKVNFESKTNPPAAQSKAGDRSLQQVHYTL